MQIALPGLFHDINDQLQLATLFLHGQLRKHFNFVAHRWEKTCENIALAKHNRLQLCRFVLQGQIPMPGGGTGKRRHLTLNPDGAKFISEVIIQVPGELADRENRF